MGELCSQPPLGVAETRLPQRSTTSMWQVSPRVVPSRCTVGSPVVTSAVRPVASPARRACTWRDNRGSRPPGRPGRTPASAVSPTSAARSATYSGASSSSSRHRAPVAEPGLAVGHRQLPALGDRVDARPRVGVQRLGAQLVEHRQHLEQRGTLAPQVGLRDLHAVPLRDDRVLPGRLERGQVVAAHQTREHLAAGVAPLGPAEGLDRLGHEPPPPRVPRGLGLGGDVGPRRRARRDQPLEHRRVAGVGEQLTRARHPAVAQPQRRPRSSSSPEQALHPLDGRRHPRRAGDVPRGRSRSPARAPWPGATTRGRAAGAARRPPRRGRPPRADRSRGRGRGPSTRTPPGSRAAGAGPCPHSTRGVGSAAVATMAGRSPPGPLRCGSTTCSTKPPATAASKALPPSSSIRCADCEASQWVDDTIPNVPERVGRVVNISGGPPVAPAGCAGSWRACRSGRPA